MRSSPFHALHPRKSFTLFVTTIAPRLRACAAIIRSFAPINLPLFLSSARISPWCSAASRDQSMTDRWRVSTSTAARFSFFRLDICTPYSNSARVTVDMTCRSSGTVWIRSSRACDERRRMQAQVSVSSMYKLVMLIAHLSDEYLLHPLGEPVLERVGAALLAA